MPVEGRDLSSRAAHDGGRDMRTGHLSIKLCLRAGSKVLFKAGLEQGVELMESRMDGTSGRFPSAIFEV